jgi:hypothetical protein
MRRIRKTLLVFRDHRSNAEGNIGWSTYHSLTAQRKFTRSHGSLNLKEKAEQNTGKCDSILIPSTTALLKVEPQMISRNGKTEHMSPVR